MKPFLSLLFAGCLTGASTCPAFAQATPSIVSAEPTVFREVAAKLDAGGSLYGYMSTDRWLGGLSSKIAEVRAFVLGIPDFQGEERALTERIFTLVEGVVKRSGLESLGGVGVSAIAVEKGLYRMRFVLQRAPETSADGYVWQWFGREPHALSWQDWLPADTVYAANLDLDLAGIWRAALEEVERAELEPLQESMAEFSAHLEEGTGMSLEEHLACFGGEIGVALVLDAVRTFKFPPGAPSGPGTVDLPEPSLVIALKVRDDKLFRVLDTLFSQNPESTAGEADGARWRSVPFESEAPFPAKPTVARAGDYLWLTSTDVLLKQILRVHQGEAPSMKGSAEVRGLSRGLPATGNSFAFVSERFSRALLEVQGALLSHAGPGGVPPMGLMQRLFGLSTAAASYGVGWQDPDGAQSVTQTTQEPSAALVGAAVVAPTAMMVAMTLPALAKAKGKAQQVQCMNNLKQIAVGMHMYANDNEEAFPPDLTSLKIYVQTTRVFICPLDPAAGQADVAWEDFDFGACSYEYLKPGLKLSGGDLSDTPVVRCKFHGSQAYADGSVRKPTP